MSTAQIEANVCLNRGHEIRVLDVLIDPPFVDPATKIQLRKSEKFCTHCGRTYDEIRRARAPRKKSAETVDKENNGQETSTS